MNQTPLVNFIKKTLKIRSDAELARNLGQSPASFNAKKIRGTIDLIEIRDLFVREGTDVKILEDFLSKPSLHIPANEKLSTSQYREVPEYNVRVSAGHGEYQGIEHVKQELQIPKQWLPDNGKVGLVKVEGDSMWPTIAHGDFVGVEFSSGYTSDGLYLIRVEDAAFVKRLQKEFNLIRIISDNPQYREMTVSPDDGSDFGLIGRVALIVRMT
jgi:phage repressor protein C with HTH and peptisase S24 domain